MEIYHLALNRVVVGKLSYCPLANTNTNVSVEWCFSWKCHHFFTVFFYLNACNLFRNSGAFFFPCVCRTRTQFGTKTRVPEALLCSYSKSWWFRNCYEDHGGGKLHKNCDLMSRLEPVCLLLSSKRSHVTIKLLLLHENTFSYDPITLKLSLHVSNFLSRDFKLYSGFYSYSVCVKVNTHSSWLHFWGTPSFKHDTVLKRFWNSTSAPGQTCAAITIIFSPVSIFGLEAPKRSRAPLGKRTGALKRSIRALKPARWGHFRTAGLPPPKVLHWKPLMCSCYPSSSRCARSAEKWLK